MSMNARFAPVTPRRKTPQPHPRRRVPRPKRRTSFVVPIVAVLIGGLISFAFIDSLSMDMGSALNLYGPLLGAIVLLITLFSLGNAVVRRVWAVFQQATPRVFSNMTARRENPAQDKGSNIIVDPTKTSPPESKVVIPAKVVEEDATDEPSIAVRRPYQLPADLARFIGRKEEIHQALRYLEEGKKEGNTVMIRGIGGVGKSTLATHLGHRLAEDYPDGQIMIDLCGSSEGPLTAVEAMANIMHSLDAKIQLPNNPAGVSGLYRRTLRRKRVLIVLDNAAGSSQVIPLQLPPPCAMIVTSRKTLDLPRICSLNLRRFSEREACSLLQEILGTSSRSMTSLSDLAQICGYLPLALRVAGAFLMVNQNWGHIKFSRALAEEQGRLSWLKVESLSLETALRLSAKLLNVEMPSLARSWQILTVFPASFDLAAATAVIGVDEKEARSRLDELVQRSLVLYEPENDRYGMHESVRNVARNRASDWKQKSTQGEEQVIQKEAAARHAAHYGKVINTADDLYRRGKRALERGLDQFDFEWRNIKAGQKWAEDHAKDNISAAELCSGYSDAGTNLLSLRQDPKDRIRWHEAGLAAVRHLDKPDVEASQLGNLGSLFFSLGETQLAIGFYEQRIDIVRKIGNRLEEGKTMADLGSALAVLDETDRAVECFEQSLPMLRGSGDRFSEGNTLAKLGNAYIGRGETHRALDLYAQALAIAREIGNRQGEGIALRDLANSYFALGEHRQAIMFADQCLTVLHEIGEELGEGKTRITPGFDYFVLDDPQSTLEFCEQCLSILRQSGDRRGEGKALFIMSQAADRLGNHAQAIAQAESALGIYEETANPAADLVRKQLEKWRDKKQEKANTLPGSNSFWAPSITPIREDQQSDHDHQKDPGAKSQRPVDADIAFNKALGDPTEGPQPLPRHDKQSDQPPAKFGQGK